MKMIEWAFIGSICFALFALSLQACTIRTSEGQVQAKYCTAVFVSRSLSVNGEGDLVVKAKEIESLNCYDVWVSPE